MNKVKSDAAVKRDAPTDRRANKIAPYAVQLKPGEKVLMDVKFSVVPLVFFYIAAAIILIIVQRVSTNMIVTALSGMLCMMTAFEAAKTVLYVQSSVALITNDRIIGISGETKFNIALKKARIVSNGGSLLIEGGSLSRVRLRCLKSPVTVAALLRDLTEK